MRVSIWTLCTLFVLSNISAALHAYKFSHFSHTGTRTRCKNLSFGTKLGLLFTGIENPRPVNTRLPTSPYTVVNIKSNVNIECWQISAGNESKGTVILFHGYTSNKSELLDRASVFLSHGFNCLLVDFMGSGGSEGNQTTIGYKESEEVRDCYNYVRQLGEQNIYLYGASMRAVAIIKSISVDHLSPKAIIIECPFSTMYETVCARFRLLGVPTVPMAGILVFWGGVENGYWGFSYRPVDDAKNINCPTLLQYGEQDEMVSRNEIDAIYASLSGPKKLITYPLAGHDKYLNKYQKEWASNIVEFLTANK